MNELDRIQDLASAMAWEATRQAPSEFDDARQEGLIRAWQVRTSRPNAANSLINASMRGRIADHVRGRKPATGKAPLRGHVDAHKTADRLPDYESAPHPVDTDAATSLAEVELRDALSALPTRDRHIVGLRFWGGLTFAEIGAELGIPPSTVGTRWSKHIRPALRIALEDA